MAFTRGVNIYANSQDSNEYVIKDKDKIAIGRFFLSEINKENRNCNIKFKFYRSDDYILLRETLELVLRAVYKDNNLNKVNINISEDMNLRAFLDIGFVLEGILTNNILVNGIYKDELILGMDREEYFTSQRNPLVSISGQRVELRLITPEDSKILCNYYIENRLHLEQYEPQRDEGFYTEETQRDILLESYRQFMNGTAIDLGIYLRGEFIGKIRISNIVQGIFKSGIVGYSIHKDYEGNGYMKEALRLLEKYAFTEMELHRLEASAMIDNKKSQRVLECCGFKKLGINEKYLFINGLWRDHITYYKIKE